MKISVFGLGYVGCVSVGCLARNGHQVIGVDTSPLKVGQINDGKATIIEKDVDEIIREERKKGTLSATLDFEKAILETEVSIVAVGTPSTSKGHLDLNYIFKVAENFSSSLEKKKGFHTIAIRSTTLPGTCDKFATLIEANCSKKRNLDFAVVSNPEFLREGTAVKDYYHPPITLIGSDHPAATEKLKTIYANLPGEVVVTDVRTSEMMKYVNNAFHALKISFANEIGNICKAEGVDSMKVMEILCKDKHLNISPYYMKPGFAYGGSCLPKDLKGLQTLAHDHYVQTPLISSIDKTNEVQIERAAKFIEEFKKKKLGFLGLSFKQGTDDLRNSPSVKLIEQMLGKGYDIRIFDHNIQMARLIGTNKDYIEQHIPHLSGLLGEGLESVIEHAEVIVVAIKDPSFLLPLKEVKGKIIFDLVHLDESLKGIEGYFGVNW